MQIAVVDHAMAVVFPPNDGPGRGARDLPHMKVVRAEALRAGLPHDVIRRPGRGRQPVAQHRRMVWFSFCGHGASTGEAPRPAGSGRVARRMVYAPQRGHLNSIWATSARPLASSLPQWRQRISVMVSISNGYGLRPGVCPDRLLRARPEHNSRRILRKRPFSACGAVVRRSFAAPVGAWPRPRLCRIIPCHATSPHTGQHQRGPSGVSASRRAWPQIGHVRPAVYTA